MSKDEILSSYLNIIYTGPNIYGVEMASNYYFDKSCAELSLAECAFLAGINHSPNYYNPFEEDSNTYDINKRTQIVLDKMLELNYINKTDYDSAISEVDAGLNFKKGKINEDYDIVYSYHTDAVISDVISDICKKKKITEKFATNYLYMGGLTIYSTQDSSIQSKLETEFEKKQYIIPSNNIENTTSQAAMVVMDHSSGYVVGCTGGLGKKDTYRGFNRATQAIRQTGSSMKPLAVIIPAVDKKILTGATIVDDTQSSFKNGADENYSPKNNEGYLGSVTFRRALESSQNIPFVKIMEKLTPSTSIKYLKKMGITTLTDGDANLALALGGIEKGISPLEMCAAYSTIANDGIYIEPIFYSKVTTSDGLIYIESKQKTKKVFSKSVAYVVKELLTRSCYWSKWNSKKLCNKQYRCCSKNRNYR